MFARRLEINVYSVKAVTVLTGISADTLRAWERRYQAVQPRREGNGRRVYSPEDVARLQLLKDVSNLGHPIGKLAKLDDGELRVLLIHKPASDSVQGTPLANRLVQAVTDYRSDMIDELLGLAITGMSPLEAARDVLAPALREVGDLWHQGNLSIAQEHLLSASMERLVFSLIHTYQKQPRGPKMLFATLSGERHAFGILLSAYIAASRRVRCYFFGTDLPAEDLIEAARRIEPDVIAISMIDSPIGDRTIQQLEHLFSELPKGVRLWLGGSAISKHELADKPKNCMLMRDLDEFNQHLDYLCTKLD